MAADAAVWAFCAVLMKPLPTSKDREKGEKLNLEVRSRRAAHLAHCGPITLA